MSPRLAPVVLLLLSGLPVWLSGCGRGPTPPDEARRAGKQAADLVAATEDYCAGMDGEIQLTPEEIVGRNSWMLWTGGNERFWNHMSQQGYGVIDFLKLIDSRGRGSRFQRLGLMNEPGYQRAAQPDEFGLYVDQAVPGVARGGLDPYLYGRSTGILGLRLFPNPEFDAAAKARWDAQRYYTDREYATSPELVRPYRIGMTCAFCHVAPHPLRPPADPENPAWENLSGTIGNQYFTNRTIFGGNYAENDVIAQILASAPPGTVDTSLMSTDYINNPNIINAVFNVAERLRIAQPETVAGGALLLPPGTAQRPVPHILVDGADTIGVVGALARVFVNIGTYSEEWLRCHNPIIGGRPARPFSIQEALQHSSYWSATVAQMPAMAAYLARAAQPMPLAAAPGGAAYLTEPAAQVDRGRQVFAENCYACHSSKQPAGALTKPITEVRTWSREPDYLAFARAEVAKPDFLENNFLSTDRRVPITLVGTNAARALQDNASRGGIWHDFSSEDFKRTPAVGPIRVQHPLSGAEWTFTPPGGGPGFYRVPSLISVWTSAPFFHNNGLGRYHHDPSVAGRLASFDDAIRKLLWPATRDGLKSVAVLDRSSTLSLSAQHLPVVVRGVMPWTTGLLAVPWLLGGAILALAAWRLWRAGRTGRKWPWVLVLLFGAVVLWGNLFAAGRLGGVTVGPLPKGFPVSLLTNLDLAHTSPLKLAEAGGRLELALASSRWQGLDDAATLKLIERDAMPALLAVNKAPDFVRDRGHPFGSTLSDEDKAALIAFLKRL